MASWLIDDQGNLHDPLSARLRTSLKAVHLAQEFPDYVLRNLGFIGLQETNGAAHLRLRPTVVSPVAFAALMYWLADREPTRIMLSTLDAGLWSHQVMGGHTVAVPKLANLIASAQDQRASDILTRPRVAAMLSSDNPLRALFNAQARLVEAFNSNQLASVLDEIDGRMRGRYTLTTSDANMRNMVLNRVGQGHEVTANFWLTRALGHRIQDFPDVTVGKWMAETYASALQHGDVRLDDVDATIEWPGLARHRYAYQRMLLPLRAGADGHALLCATLKDPSIDLRFKAG
jgi:hypothetical protein